jgi:hypothetical protein
MLKRLWIVLSIGWAALILTAEWGERRHDFTPPPLSSHEGPSPAANGWTPVDETPAPINYGASIPDAPPPAGAVPIDFSSYGTYTPPPSPSSHLGEWLFAFALALAPFAAMPVMAWIWAGRKRTL